MWSLLFLVPTFKLYRTCLKTIFTILLTTFFSRIYLRRTHPITVKYIMGRLRTQIPSIIIAKKPLNFIVSFRISAIPSMIFKNIYVNRRNRLHSTISITVSLRFPITPSLILSSTSRSFR